MFKHFLKIILASCALFLVFGFNNIFAAGNYFYKSINVDITVNKDSTFDVIENQTYNLNGSFGYFIRELEQKNLDHISDIEVFGSNGEKLDKSQYKISNEGNVIKIQWDFERRNFNNELKSWAIKYRVHGGLGFYKDYDELYWNAIFAGSRTVPVESADVIVHLPSEFNANQIQQRMFIGSIGSKSESKDFKIIDGKTIEFKGNNIQPGQYLTIVATWPKGAVVKPFLYRNQIINWIVLIIALALPIFVFRKSYRAWKKSGKDPKITKTIIAQYEPPLRLRLGQALYAGDKEYLPPAIMGVLVNQNVSVRDIVATVIDLAVRGYLKIREVENKVLFFKAKEYIFEKLKPEDDGLNSYEKEIISRIFHSSDSVSSSELKNKFYTDIPEITKAIYRAAEETGYFTGNIEEVRKRYRRPAILMILLAGFTIPLLIFFGAYVGGYTVVYLFLLILSIVISMIIANLFAYYMPAATKEGAEEKWKALGFKEYLNTAERFRIGAETLDTFSKFLPYAMVLGVEKQWADRFADFSYKEQGWYAPMYVGGNIGAGNMQSFTNFTSSFSAFSNSISSTFSLSPHGGSGMGGGGGAGGGGGGGGGGAG